MCPTIPFHLILKQTVAPATVVVPYGLLDTIQCYVYYKSSFPNKLYFQCPPSPCKSSTRRLFISLRKYPKNSSCSGSIQNELNLLIAFCAISILHRRVTWCTNTLIAAVVCCR
eukprot:35363_1